MDLRKITDQHIIELLNIFGYEKSFYCETSHSSLILFKKVVEQNGSVIIYNIYGKHLLIIRDGYYDIKENFTSRYHLSAINYLQYKGYELKSV